MREMHATPDTEVVNHRMRVSTQRDHWKAYADLRSELETMLATMPSPGARLFLDVHKYWSRWVVFLDHRFGIQVVMTMEHLDFVPLPTYRLPWRRVAAFQTAADWVGRLGAIIITAEATAQAALTAGEDPDPRVKDAILDGIYEDSVFRAGFFATQGMTAATREDGAFRLAGWARTHINLRQNHRVRAALDSGQVGDHSLESELADRLLGSAVVAWADHQFGEPLTGGRGSLLGRITSELESEGPYGHHEHATIALPADNGFERGDSAQLLALLADREESQQQIARLTRRATPRQRAAIALLKAENSPREAAQQLGITTKAFQKLLRRIPR